jgi:hypothetical protein
MSYQTKTDWGALILVFGMLFVLFELAWIVINMA